MIITITLNLTLTLSLFLSPISYPIFPISYLLSPISYLLSPIPYPLSPISYLLSPISHLYVLIFIIIIRFIITCKHKAIFCLHPKDVETALGESPRGVNRVVKELQRAILGLSSATTTRVLTQPSWTPRDLSWDTDPPKPRVHNSITPR